MKAIRAGFRVLRVLAHVASGYLTIRLRFGTASTSRRQAHVQAWASGFCRILGVRTVIEGNTQTCTAQGMLLVSNHISWLDILVLLAVRPVRFVSKSEVAHWPMLGPMASGAGTLFIERASKRDAMRVMHRMAEALKAGDCVGVFPEGTTGDGSKLLAFHANLLQAAVSAHAPALPVVLGFFDPVTGEISQAARYIADDSLAGSVWRLLTARGIEVRLKFLEPRTSGTWDRRTWAGQLHTEMGIAHSELSNPT